MRLALTSASKLVLDLSTPEGWKAELTKATRQCTGRELNLRFFDHKSSALTTTPSNAKLPPVYPHITIYEMSVLSAIGCCHENSVVLC